MQILSAEPKHIPHIQTLRDLLNNERQNNFSEKNKLFHSRMNGDSQLKPEDISRDIILISTNEHEITGFIRGSMHERSGHTLSKLGSIDELFILKKYRKKGIAKQLFTSLIEKFKGLDCDHVTLHTDAENTAAQQLYESVGLEKATIEYWKNI